MVVLPLLVQRRTPNQSSRNGHRVTHLVWHSTAGYYHPSCDWLCNPVSESSAHLVLDEHGDAGTQLVHLEQKAWHAYPTWNLISVGVEHASVSETFATFAQQERSARVFAWLCWHLGIAPVFGLHRPSGIVRHRDLGLAGGGHSDGPSDATWFGLYLPAVQLELRRGGFRKTWAL